MSNTDNMLARRADPAEVTAKFQGLVQSPLRAAILRFMCARPEETFDVEALMQTFGRMRLDVENCVRELVAFGITKKIPGPGAQKYGVVEPDNDVLHELLDEFLERRATVSTEDRSPAVQRFREMIGRDEKMLVIFEWIRTAAKSDISVLILGPTGSGKEVVARMIHELSRRGTNKFQAVNCAALPDTLFESEIFGYEKGAFTGAHDRKPGRLEHANNGTLFLDEIGDLDAAVQPKLLRFLESGEIHTLGDPRPTHTRVRVVAATNANLESLVSQGRFRSDLFYRLRVATLSLPPLRERKDEIPALAATFVRKACKEAGRRHLNVGADFVAALLLHEWPGNIRQLANEVRRAVAIVDDGATLTAQELSPEIAEGWITRRPAPPETPAGPVITVRLDQSLDRAVDDIERAFIRRALQQTEGRVSDAARLLGISRKGLFLKRKKLGLD